MTPDHQLKLRDRHPDFQTFLDWNEEQSQRMVDTLPHKLDVPYGSAPLQTLDVFPSSAPNSPVLLFFHGGYWRALDKHSYRFVAEPFVRNGVTVFVVNYRLIPSVSMQGLLEDVDASLHWIQEHAARFNGDPNRIALSGHSAGGHLALMAYLRNPTLRPSIHAICSLSGIFDLAPIQDSYLNDVLQLTDDDVQQFSINGDDLEQLQCPTLISVGGNETDFFIDESKQLCLQHPQVEALEYLEYAGLNHYEIVHQLGRENSPLVRFLIQHLQS